MAWRTLARIEQDELHLCVDSAVAWKGINGFHEIIAYRFQCDPICFSHRLVRREAPSWEHSLARLRKSLVT